MPVVLAQVPIYSGDAATGRDAGDTREKAVRISPGSYSGSFDGPADTVDAYVFDAPAGALVKVKLRAPSTAGVTTLHVDRGAPALAIDAPDGRVSHRVLPAPLSFVAWENGDWVVKLLKRDGLTYDFELEVTLLPLQNDAGTGGDAVPLWTSPTLTGERTIEGWVGGIDDSDAYVTELAEGDWTIRLDTDATHDVQLVVEHKERLVELSPREMMLRVSEAADFRFAVATRGTGADYTVHLEQVGGMLPDDAMHVVETRAYGEALIPAGDGKSVYALNHSHIVRVDESGAHPHVEAELHMLAGLDPSGRVFGIDHPGALRSYDPSGVVPHYVPDDGRLREVEFGPHGGGVALVQNYNRSLLVSLHLDGTRTLAPLALQPWRVLDLAFAPDGTLYASTREGLHRIDPATGETELVMPLESRGPLAFDAAGFAYMVTGRTMAVLLRVDLTQNVSMPVAFLPGEAYALAFSGERLWFSGDLREWCCRHMIGYLEMGGVGFEGFRSQLTPPALAELAVTSVRVEPRDLLSPGLSENGREYRRILVDVTNLGEADVERPFDVRVYAWPGFGAVGLSSSATGRLLWDSRVVALPSGATTTLEFDWDVTLRAGNYTVVAEADSGGPSRVLEADESENNRAQTHAVVRVDSDLVVQAYRDPWGAVP